MDDEGDRRVAASASLQGKELERGVDPLVVEPSNTIQEGDHFILSFVDGRQVFGCCEKLSHGKSPPIKVAKRSFCGLPLKGLPYGTVLELGPRSLTPLPAGEGLLPAVPDISETGDLQNEATTSPTNGSELAQSPAAPPDKGNRDYVDSNTSQSLNQLDVARFRETGMEGAAIVRHMIENSTTFQQKTKFSREKYITKKQMKHQPRCRVIKCNPATITEAMYIRATKRMMNLREDTMGQLLSYSNLSAGSRVLVWETCLGVLTGCLVDRLGGYGTVYSIHNGPQPTCIQLLSRFNFTFAESLSLRWVHAGDLIGDYEEEEDTERLDRGNIKWPCPLQDHTRSFLETLKSRKEQVEFFKKRCDRFVRKLTRPSSLENRDALLKQDCDSLIIAVRYDPTETLMALWKYLAPSAPFVVYCEFAEPLCRCFLELQSKKIAINLRLSDTWAREYQVMPNRTHPNMTMSQSGGFILTGVKLHPETGINEIDPEVAREVRERLGGRRGKKSKSKEKDQSPNNSKRHKPDGMES